MDWFVFSFGRRRVEEIGKDSQEKANIGPYVV